MLTPFSYLLSLWQTWNIFNAEFYLGQIDSNLFYWASIKWTVHMNIKCYLLLVIYILFEQGTTKGEIKGIHELTCIFQQINKWKKENCLQFLKWFLMSFPQNSPKSYILKRTQGGLRNAIILALRANIPAALGCTLKLDWQNVLLSSPPLLQILNCIRGIRAKTTILQGQNWRETVKMFG